MSALEPSFARDCVVIVALTLVMLTVGVRFGIFIGEQRGFYNGVRAGRAEERSFLNARMIRAKLQAFKDGVTVGLNRFFNPKP